MPLKRRDVLGEQQRLFSPRPGTPGRGVGGEGPWPGIVRSPPTPDPSPPKRGRGEVISCRLP